MVKQSTSMNVSLPSLMKDWVESQVKSGQYGNVSDYVRDLIRKDQNEHEKIKILQHAITQGIESGISDKSILDILKTARLNAQSI